MGEYAGDPPPFIEFTLLLDENDNEIISENDLNIVAED